ncbi:3-oxoadipate enol-lactonase [Herbaspirillum sp. alder98]|uniref:3-oxoadipate enol-lactonase n=1 Tax=Herbaspirillum sp. alder98 TaxID=2913096 RepID=UPI001CD867DD|nr:3-oxoadipate enol-lactonase [Herbaspirillum sp. alder98]MCA1326711.1 3-oxoadipate enol-lactonase [Herbaspirillum sp. alder98]
MTAALPSRLHYTLEGPAGAPVLVLSNSLGTSLSMWQGQAEALRTQWRVLRYDTRGHGRSTIAGLAADAAFTLEQLGRDVIGLMDSLEIERAHFCGISMGGITGLWLGVHAPERLLSLTVANSAARIGNADAWNTRAQQVVEKGMTELAAGAPGRWFTNGFTARSPALVNAMTDELATSSATGYAACCRALASADLRDEIAGIKLPTLVIAGRDDPVTTVADAQFMCERIDAARYVEVPASHLSNIEAPSEFTHALSDFLD